MAAEKCHFASDGKRDHPAMQTKYQRWAPLVILHQSYQYPAHFEHTESLICYGIKLLSKYPISLQQPQPWATPDQVSEPNLCYIQG